MVCIFVDRNLLGESQKTTRIKGCTKVQPSDGMCEIQRSHELKKGGDHCSFCATQRNAANRSLSEH